jgi:hypothetical protein
VTSAAVPSDVAGRFAHLRLTDGDLHYLSFHQRRYRLLLEVVQDLLRDQDGASILDVGPSFQTGLLRALPRLRVSTLGFEDLRFPPRSSETHVHCDLNDAQDPNRWPAVCEEFDGVVFAEVLEHLYTAPTLVLRMLGRFVRPGGWLLVQTPNAVRLSARARMVLGRNPFELIREDATNPGHFREYTLDELRHFGEQAGFRVERFAAAEYFTPPGRARGVYRTLAGRLPSRLRSGLTIVYERPA